MSGDERSTGGGPAGSGSDGADRGDGPARGDGPIGASAQPFGDALTRAFWEAASEGRLIIQRCGACGHHQFYPRPLCLECESPAMDWVEAAGDGTIYSMTTVHIAVSPDFEPPYIVALVELDEGPRLLSLLVDDGGELLTGGAAIGDRVRIAWRPREGAPQLPVFRPFSSHD